MGYWPWLEREPPAKRRRRAAERRRAIDAQRACYRAWLKRYQSYGLGWNRADEYARKRAARGIMPK